MKLPGYAFYRYTFGGKALKEEEYFGLAQASYDILRSLCTRDFPENDQEINRAIVYQVEMLVCQGGRDALGGRGVSSGITEELGDYTIGYRVGNGEMNRVKTVGGVPISGVSLAILTKKGLMCRAAGERRGRR